MTFKKYLSTIEDLSKRKIVLAGGTSGIGLALLKHLKSKNAYVILLARNLTKANEIINVLNYPKIDVVHYEQSSYLEIEKAIDELLKRHPDFDTVVLNAGVLAHKGISADGHPFTAGVNYFGAKHFIEYLSPKLHHDVKFVVQGSITAGARLSKNVDIECQKYGIFKQYNISKIYLEAYIYKLMKDKPYKNIEYILTEPGVCKTNITRHLSCFVRKGGNIVLPIILHSAKKASLTLLIGISEKSHNGDYIVPRGIFTLSGFPKYKKFPSKREREFLFK